MGQKDIEQLSFSHLVEFDNQPFKSYTPEKLAGLESIAAIIKEADDDTAKLILVNSNLNQRDKFTYREKAFAYKTRLEAMKHQGKRTDLTSVPVGQKPESKTTRELIAAESGGSNKQIQCYIRLT